MVQLIGALNFLISIYMMLIFVRIILTWFSWLRDSQIRDILGRITDPYLNLFRRFMFLRIGHVDLSPMVAIVTLSLISRFLATLALQGRITIGITLALILQALWGLVSVILGLLIIVCVLRLIGHLTRQSNYSRFWYVVDSIYKPVSDKISRPIFKDRIASFTTTIVVCIAVLVALYLILRLLVLLVSGILMQFPI